MHEMCQSGSEGGAKPYFVPTPIDVKRLHPGGTVEVIVSPSVSRIGSIVPLGRAIFPRDSRHFVPGSAVWTFHFNVVAVLGCPGGTVRS